MLRRLPIEAASLGRAAGDESWLDAQVEALLATRPLDSPLASFALEREGAELVLVRYAVREPSGGEPPGALLARLRRRGESRYELLRAPDTSRGSWAGAGDGS